MSEDLPTSNRDWANLVGRTAKAILFGVASIFATVLVYAATTYVRDVARSESATATSPYAEIPPRVQTLLEFKERSEVLHKETADHLGAVSSTLIRIESANAERWSAQAEQNRRVLELLDRMDRRLSRIPALDRPGGSP